jgi:hypothetical protein
LACLIHLERGNQLLGANCEPQKGDKHAALARQLTSQAPREPTAEVAMFASLTTVFPSYQCACCERRVAQAVYQEGAFFCLECARGEHRHPGWGREAA